MHQAGQSCSLAAAWFTFGFHSACKKLCALLVSKAALRQGFHRSAPCVEGSWGGVAAAAHPKSLTEGRTCAALQGHVVAEQQLPIPNAWLKIPQPKPAAAPFAAQDGKLTLANKSHDGAKRISVSGPDGLHVEVCAPCWQWDEWKHAPC